MSIFLQPVPMGENALWLVLPLCAAVGAAYKTVRVRHLRRLPMQILGLWAYMLVGLVALGLALYLLQYYVA